MKIYTFSKRFLLTFMILSLLMLIFSVDSDCQIRVRTEPKIPDIPGYVTLKCDFHMHTVFSDGNVWPPIRTEEAWMYFRLRSMLSINLTKMISRQITTGHSN